MKVSEENRLAYYKELAPLRSGVTLVQHTVSGQIFVKKRLSVFNASVFARLKEHPVEGIPRIIEAIPVGEQLIVIEEYISGYTLTTWISSHWLHEETQICGLMLQLCRIVERLHRADPVIIHRDIKPSNVIVTYDGSVRLLDMNAAKYYDPEETQDTQLIGTVGYAAPEQYGFGASGMQTDIYSIGILLQEMLQSAGLVSSALSQIAEKCTRLDPKDRYPAIGELISDLAAFSAHPEPSAARAEPASFLPPGFRTGNPTHMALAVCGYAVIGLFGCTYTAPTGAAWMNRLAFLAAFFLSVFFTCNYRNSWHLLGVDRVKSPIGKTLLILLADVGIVAACLFLLIFVESRG